MIDLDASSVLRALTRSPDPVIQAMNEQAGELLQRAERGTVALTTADAVIADVAFILTAKAHDQLPVAEVAGRLGALVSLRGMKLRQKRVLLRALDLWAAQPPPSFADALTAAYAHGLRSDTRRSGGWSST